MSQSAASQPKHGPRHAVRRTEPHPRAAPKPATRSGYTIAHHGRQVRLGPVAFWIAVGTVVIMAGWSITTATYFAFRDDVLRGLIAHQNAVQTAYEDRIAELRAQIDRTTSRQLLDQEQVEQKLEDLTRRQSLLESRAGALSAIGDPATTGSIKPAARNTPDPTAPTADPAKPARAGGKQSSLAPSSLGQSNLGQSRLDAVLGRIEASLDRVERRQAANLGAMQERFEGKAHKIRAVLAQLGLKIEQAAPAATGGPFVPVRLPSDALGFERTLARVRFARADSDHLSTVLATVPVRKPVTGEIDLTSTFGVRVDPFIHVAAMHTGLDFRGDTGEPIHATAAGTVSNAGWSGGYGKMVEIEHGNGLATRYGHLSEIDVEVGQKVGIGQVIGRLGSTGRSTGPHLHYETRVDGEAVDPEKFLDAGEKLFGG